MQHIIRAPAVLHWNKSTDLFVNLSELLRCNGFLTNFRSSTTTKLYMLLGMIGSGTILCVDLFLLYESLDFGQGGQNVSISLPLTVFELIGNYYFGLLRAVSEVYAIIYLTFVGPALLDMFGAIMKQFSQAFLESSRSDLGDGWANRYHRDRVIDGEDRMQAFRMEFAALDACYGSYKAIAGYYVFAIVQRAFASIILVLSAAMALTSFGDQPTVNYLWNSGEILAVILIANFGSLLHERVNNVKI